MKEFLDMLNTAKEELILTASALFESGKVIIGTAIAVPTFGTILLISHLASRNKK